MKFFTGPEHAIRTVPSGTVPVLLYGTSSVDGVRSAGSAVRAEIRKRNWEPSEAAWDFLSLALSVVVADGAISRGQSPDGWTRQIFVDVALANPDRWDPLIAPLEQALEFLTTDIWQVSLRGNGQQAEGPKKLRCPEADAVMLLSGGLDSLIGAIDLSRSGVRPLPVSKTVRGDADRQVKFARVLGLGSDLLQLNDNSSTPRAIKETSQRSRSLLFLAFAVLAATSTALYKSGERVPLFVCENGFIAINPPMTPSRIGSLSTRTTHPEFLSRIQQLFDSAGINVEIRNPYSKMTKGEMLVNCSDQATLLTEAVESTSCGRFQRFNYTHCGRCVPCQIRRAAFLRWGAPDTTDYVYDDLGRRTEEFAGFDDVRSVAIAIEAVKLDGIDMWLGPALRSVPENDRAEFRAMLGRGLDELEALHSALGVS